MSLAMNRANTVYLCVFGIFIFGIWIILDLGSAFLTAPRDLTGNWKLATPPPALDASTAFSIDQSGKYVRFAFDRGPTVDVVMTQTPGDKVQTFTFTGQGWNITGTGPGIGDNLNFTFHPPASKPAPPSGTYQRVRIGQETPPAQQSAAQRATSRPAHAVH